MQSFKKGTEHKDSGKKNVIEHSTIIKEFKVEKANNEFWGREYICWKEESNNLGHYVRSYSSMLI